MFITIIGSILFIGLIVAIITLDIVKQIKDKKDGQVIDLADFEYDSKKQIFRKKVEEENFATKMSKVNDRTDISYEGLSGNMFNSDDD